MKKKIGHKFHAVRTEYNGFPYDSKAEAAYAAHLDKEIEAGNVIFYLRQTRLDLPAKTRFVCDFTVFKADQTVEFVDVKGMETEVFRLKKRMIEAAYPIELKIVKRKCDY